MAHTEGPPGPSCSRRSAPASRRPTCRCRCARGRGGTTPAPRRAGSTRSTAAGRPSGPTGPTTRPRPSRSSSTRTSRPAGHEFFPLGVFDVVPRPPAAGLVDRHRPAPSATTCASATSRRGVDLPDEIPDTYYGTAWAADSRHLLLRAARRRHAPVPAVAPPARHAGRRRRARPPGGRRALLPRRRTDQGRAVPRAPPRLARSPTRCRVLDGRRPDRRRSGSSSRASQDVEYGIEHHGDRFFIVTNADGAEDFKLVEAPDAAPGRAHVARGHPPPARREADAASTCSPTTSCCSSGPSGLRQIRVRRLADGDEHVIEQPEAVSTAIGRGQPRVRHRRRSATATRRWSRRVGVRLRPRHAASARCSSSSRCSAATTRTDYVTERLWAHRRRRDAGADLARVPARPARGTARPGPALRLRLLRGVAWTRASPRSACRCSTGASCSPSPTSGAAARWAGAGTSTASSCTSATRSPTSSPCARHLVRRGLDVARRSSPSGAASPAAC